MSDYSSVSARTVRAALKARGLEHTVQRVSSGKDYSHVTLHYDHKDRHADVLAALRNLWDDGQYRVRETMAGYIWISRANYWQTKHGSHRHPEALVARFTDLQRAYLIWLARGAKASMVPTGTSTEEIRSLIADQLVHLSYGAEGFQITEEGMKIYRELMGA